MGAGQQSLRFCRELELRSLRSLVPADYSAADPARFEAAAT